MLAYLDPSPGQVILDCGAGMAFYLKVISALSPGCHLVGVDAEEAVLGYAHAHVANQDICMIQGDVHHLSFREESFDGVVMSEVLEHLEAVAPALGEGR